MIQTPPYLKKGDTIALVAPARSIATDKVNLAVDVFNSWGLKVKKGRHLSGKHFQYSGTVDERLADMQQMIDDAEVNTIVCAGGGYGSIHLLGLLKTDNLRLSPKWLVGFSDITVLHSLFYGKARMATLHATMPVKFESTGVGDASLTSLHTALFGLPLAYTVPAMTGNIAGKTKGQVVGGNLSLLYSLLGTPYDIDFTHKILFIEEVDEYLYHIDRMVQAFKLAGKLDKLSGLLVGGFNKIHDNESPFGMDVTGIISQAVKSYGYPVAFGFPAGHDEQNLALILGIEAELEVTESYASLKY